MSQQTTRPAEPATCVEHADAEDGARIALRRRPNPDGPPAILIHGLAVNVDLWDLPTVTGEGFEYRSLATVLHEAGCDVWLVNLRGNGAPGCHSEPPAGQRDWCVDHFILYDVPAAVEHVASRTGGRPFVVGSSMGAMSLAGWLQGARLDGAESPCIIADAEAARRRGEAIAGAVFVQFPAALRWPQSLYDDDGQLRWKALLQDWRRVEADANYPFELLSRFGWLQAIIEAAGNVRLDWVRPMSDKEELLATLPAPLADAWRKAEHGFVRAMTSVYNRYKGTQNTRPEMFLSGGIRSAVDHMKAGVLRQLSKSVRAGAFVSGLGDPAHVYSQHYHRINTPLLVALGGKDRIANVDVTREVFFDQVASADKTLKFYPQIAHGEFEAAPIAYEQVYPDIRAWIATRAR